MSSDKFTKSDMEIVMWVFNKGFNAGLDAVIEWWKYHHPEDIDSPILNGFEALRKEVSP